MSTMHRERIEEALIAAFAEIRPFTFDKTRRLDRFKDGSFGCSALSFSLYANGHNGRGQSSIAPLGLLYEDEHTMMCIGYFRKEHDPDHEPGYLFVVAPRGREVVEKIRQLINFITYAHLPCKGCYVRHLSLQQYITFLNAGFMPAKEAPWNPEAIEEDESLQHALLDLQELLNDDGGINVLKGDHSRAFRRRARINFNRGMNFLQRNDLVMKLRPFTHQDISDADNIIKDHFVSLSSRGKDVGSVPEDHYNSIDPAGLEEKDIMHFIGYLDDIPIAFYACERLSDRRVGLYTVITERDPDRVLPHSEKDALRGFSALPMYCYLRLFRLLKEKGFDEVHLGGSEHPDLNRFKRHFGCTLDPSYWAFMPLKGITP
ncbi:MAG: hypothetical protein ABIC95_02430 [archaeon]